MSDDASASTAAVLVSHLTLTPEPGDVWSSEPTPTPLRVGPGRVFGGQVVAQALLAAEASVPDGRPVGSFHCRFLRPGNVELPIHYHASRDLDGRSFTHRRIVAEQDGKPILTASVMCHAPEPGLAHEPQMPAVIGPDQALAALHAAHAAGGPLAETTSRFVSPGRTFDLAPVDVTLWDVYEPRHEPVLTWMRFRADLPDDPALHRAILAYISDSTLMQPSDIQHGLSWTRGEVNQASLDHMVWFHDDFRADEWLLYITESPWARHGRMLTRGEFYRQDGRMVATVAQEALTRLTGLGTARLDSRLR